MSSGTTETLKIRGLAKIASCILGLWGGVVSLKALYDLFEGEPEANLYSARPWQFITQAQWLRYGGFELAYGACCGALAWTVWRYSRFLPETTTRSRREPMIKLFD